MRTVVGLIAIGVVFVSGCGDHEDQRQAPTTPTPTITASPGVRADPPCSFDGTECQGFCFTGRCIYDEGTNACICQPAFDVACDEFALGGCGGHACFGPGEICVTIAESLTVPMCGCVPPSSREAGAGEQDSTR
jgi:hypothetical protein